MSTFHPFAWLAWLAAAALAALLTRNPLYLLLLLLATGVAYLGLDRRSPTARSWGAFVRLGALLLLITIPWNALNVHVGDIVLFRLPQSWPLIGGPITLEAALFGLGSGLSLLVILLVFATFSSAVDQARLLRMTPAFLQAAGVTVGIAVTFVPQMVLASRDIREAQRIRGHRFRGLRSLLPLFMPLLTTGLERAISLAESMEARGFGAQQALPAGRSTRYQAGTVLALLLLAAGAFSYAYFPAYRLIGGGLMAASAVGLIVIFRAQGRGVARTRYRRWHWERWDTILVACSGIVALALLATRIIWPEALIYYPYPPYGVWPEFHPLLGLALALLALPGLLLASSQRRRPQAA